jgi:hypothetical protein
MIKQPEAQRYQSEEAHVNALALILSVISYVQDTNLSTMPLLYTAALIYKLSRLS